MRVILFYSFRPGGIIGNSPCRLQGNAAALGHRADHGMTRSVSRDQSLVIYHVVAGNR